MTSRRARSARIETRAHPSGRRRAAAPQQEQACRRVALDVGGLAGGFDELEVGAGVVDTDEQIRVPGSVDASRERFAGPGSRARPTREQRVGEDAHGVIEQLGTGEQLVAGVVVADEVPPVHGELLAQVQLDVVDRHPPADPGDRRVAAARARREDRRSSAARRPRAGGAARRRRSPRSRPRVRRTSRTRGSPGRRGALPPGWRSPRPRTRDGRRARALSNRRMPSRRSAAPRRAIRGRRRPRAAVRSRRSPVDLDDELADGAAVAEGGERLGRAVERRRRGETTGRTAPRRWSSNSSR